MAKLAGISLCVISLALTLTIAPTASFAGANAPPAETPPSVALQCHDKAITGSGPGFSSSKEQSETTAKESWLVKARAIFGDASWETAKEPGISCAKQGLYSKCFAMAFPCGSTPGDSAAVQGK